MLVHVFSTFRFFRIRDHLGLSARAASSAAFVGVLVYTIVLVIIGQAAGFVSDRVGRSTIFVLASTDPDPHPVEPKPDR